MQREGRSMAGTKQRNLEDETMGSGDKISHLLEQAQRVFARHTEADEGVVCPLSDLLLLRHTKTTTLEATFYEPVVCLILQGEKETILGERRLRFGAGESLIVSHELPVASQITVASAARPYMALVLTLDLSVLRGLYEQVSEAQLGLDGAEAHAMEVRATDGVLLDVLSRYLSLCEEPLEQEILAPLVRKELHFRLLMASHGGMLRRLLWRDSHASRISRAIGMIRQRFRNALVMPELAKAVGMSSSSFHKHFKSITMTTPLQYQKNLRLLEARRLLLQGEFSVSTAALEVGYESPTQFSREYARKFGVSPRHDLA